MPHTIMPVPFKPHRLQGLSDRLLESHYENNYGGAVRRLNAIEKRLAELDWRSAPVFDINGLKREELIAANSMILHEIYFDGIGGSGDPTGSLAGAIERDFGSVAAWKTEFSAIAKAQAGGSGWTLLTYSERHGRLVNQWAADHANGIANGKVILALDMYEHAYHIDFGSRAGAYVDAFIRNIAWDRVGMRFARDTGARPESLPAPEPAQISVEDLRDQLARDDEMVVLDVRLQEDSPRFRDRIANTEYRDPEQVEAWAGALPRDVPIVVYCMYGFWVSQDTATALRKRGLDARSLAGGIAAWRAIGAPTAPLN
jgi:Fe-Mn family superoxide dismutase